ncbi:MAG: exo-alpha-sialidase [Clostridia bacterium]|nr:exo-alpha-sialidase [Clostridia bacterium]
MKISTIGVPGIVMSNPESHHNYFGWPTAARLQNGKIAVAASAYRLRHVCPFGKMAVSYSEDDGETYTAPAPVIDTVLDDRDGGIVPFGKSGVIVTSFNNTVAFQRQHAQSAYDLAYLDSVMPEEESAALGATFRISLDGGVTFGPIYKSPITSPHGPAELPDGSLLWVGRTFSSDDTHRAGIDRIEAHKVNLDGTMEFVSAIEKIEIDGKEALSCEPHAIVLPDGTILAHIRVQVGGEYIFTVFQSESKDGGKTWSKPRQLLKNDGGSPPHLFIHSSGVLVCTYGFRGSPRGAAPFGIKAMLSTDNGRTWDVDHELWMTETTADLGYPSTVELRDGSLLTVFYAHPEENTPAVIMQQKWRIEL